MSLSLTAGFWGCGKGDGFKDTGYELVYLTQATTSGGISNEYAVPAGEGKYTYNFKVEDGKLKIIMTVLRSGSSEGKGFSVNVTPMVTETVAYIASGAVADGVLLPDGKYTLPTNVSVPSGKNFAAFYLEVEIPTIRDSAYDNKKLMLQVGISNPTAYKLNDDLAYAIIVIDVKKMREKL